MGCVSSNPRTKAGRDLRKPSNEPSETFEKPLAAKIILNFDLRDVVRRASANPLYADAFLRRQFRALHARLEPASGGSDHVAQAIQTTNNADHLACQLDLAFGRLQKFNFRVFASDGTSEILLGQRCLLLLDDSEGVAAGASCEVQAEEATAHLTTVQIELRTAESPSAGILQKQLFPSQLVILRPTVDGNWVEAYKTEVQADGIWPAFKVTMDQLCGGDTGTQLRLQAWAAGPERGRPRESVLLGEALVSVLALQDACISGEIALAPMSLGVNRSHLRIKVCECTVSRRPSFLDYIKSMCEVKWMVGIDFASTPDASSIHAAQTAGWGPCQTALSTFGSILEVYDAKRSFPVWGFGGRMGAAAINSCFPLNGNGFQPEIVGVQGVLEAYSKALRVITPQGPMQLGPVIRAASNQVESYSFTNRQCFAILLLLLGGCPSDMEATLETLREASGMPLTVLLLGIGDADFGPLQELAAIHSNLPPAPGQLRDVACQFVQWPREDHASAEHVASQLLEDVPHHLLAYFRSRQELPKLA